MFLKPGTVRGSVAIEKDKHKRKRKIKEREQRKKENTCPGKKLS
jgi:hypothetical protein